MDHVDERVDRALQQLVQGDSLAPRVDGQHRPFGLGETNRGLDDHFPIGTLRNRAEPFAKRGGAQLGLGGGLGGLGLGLHVLWFAVGDERDVRREALRASSRAFDKSDERESA